MKRGVVIAALVIAGTIAVTIYLIVTSLDSIVMAAIEKYGTEITRTEVSLRAVRVSPSEGRVALTGLRIRNPQGFQSSHAFKLEKITVSMDIGTITTDTIIVRNIMVDKPFITYELAPGGSNIAWFQRTIESQKGASGGGRKDERAAKSPKLSIDNIYIRGGEIEFSASFLKRSSLTLSLPDIHLKDLGKGKGGASPREIAGQIMTAVGKSVASVARQSNLEKLLGVRDKDLERARRILEAVPGSLPPKAKRTVEKLKHLLH